MRYTILTPLVLSLSLTAQHAWELSPATGPSHGLWPGMAYAMSTSKCYLYGGASGTTTSDETWSYDGTTWAQMLPTTNPGERHTFAICYDSIRDVIVMFGGADGNYVPSGETWEYHPTTNTWTNVTPASGASPQARWGCHMIYDLARNVSVLHGGYSGAGFTPDTWEWDGTTWNLIVTNNSPSPRDRFGFAYDMIRAKGVLFGGISAAASDETWEYDGVDWTLIATPTTPLARQKVRLAYDLVRGVCVMQGGQNGSQLNDSWEYDGINWRQIASTPAPARGENASAYDIARGVTVIFGGYGSTGTSTQTWEHRVATSAQFNAYGSGCVGSGGVPSMQALAGSAPTVGSTFTLEIRNLPAAGGAGYVFFGTSNYQFGPLWFPLDTAILGWAGCSGYAAPDTGQFFLHPAGIGSVNLTIPNNPAIQNVTLYAQALSFDAAAANGQVAMSNAGEIIIY